MSDIRKTVKVHKKDGTVCDYDVSFKDSGDTSISVTLADGTEKVFSDDDLFKSLKLIRAYFEVDGSKLLCNGARVDVYPSGMSRGMGRGRKAYILIQGKQARRENLVDIFDYAEPSLVDTIGAQEAFYKSWVASLG
jgi:hypothetical protein